MTSCMYTTHLMAFYDTDFVLGFVLHRCMTGTSRVQEQHQDDLIAIEFFKSPEATAVTALPVGEITDRVHSGDNSFSNASGIILNELSVTRACQCGHKLHKIVTPSWINVLICIRQVRVILNKLILKPCICKPC